MKWMTIWHVDMSLVECKWWIRLKCFIVHCSISSSDPQLFNWNISTNKQSLTRNSFWSEWGLIIMVKMMDILIIKYNIVSIAIVERRDPGLLGTSVEREPPDSCPRRSRRTRVVSGWRWLSRWSRANIPDLREQSPAEIRDQRIT